MIPEQSEHLIPVQTGQVIPEQSEHPIPVQTGQFYFKINPDSYRVLKHPNVVALALNAEVVGVLRQFVPIIIGTRVAYFEIRIFLAPYFVLPIAIGTKAQSFFKPLRQRRQLRFWALPLKLALKLALIKFSEAISIIHYFLCFDFYNYIKMA